MLLFIIPLMSKQVAKDFHVVSNKLEQTLRSICNQGTDDYEVVVVCHERPEIGFSHSKIHYAEVDFDLVSCIKEKDLTVGITTERDFIHRRTDKGRKMLYGYYFAQQFNPTHIMFVDADDFVSNRLAAHCSANPDCAGWYVEKGYRYREFGSWIYLKRTNFHMQCGTGFIMKNNIIPAKPPLYNEGFDYYKFFIAHQSIVRTLREAGTPLLPLAFYAVVYVLHSSSFYATEKSREYRYSIYNLLKIVINMRPLTQSIRSEFGILPASSSVTKQHSV
ncbi:MAG: glycosyltransferase family 2 protein [Planctomycetota bacterium]